MVDGVLRILERHLIIVIRPLSTTCLSYLLECRKWSLAGIIVLELLLENSAIAKIVPFLFVEMAPPRLVILSLGVFDLALVGIWLETPRLLIAYGQDFLRTISLRLLAFGLVLGFLDLFVLLLATFTSFLRNVVVSIDVFVPLDCFRSGGISIGHLEEIDDSSQRI